MSGIWSTCPAVFLFCFSQNAFQLRNLCFKMAYNIKSKLLHDYILVLCMNFDFSSSKNVNGTVKNATLKMTAKAKT